MSKKNGLVDFFETLADAVQIFCHPTDVIDHANCKNCRVTVGKKKNNGKIVFQFLARHEKLVSIKIDMVEMSRNPKEYIEAMLDSLAERQAEICAKPIIFLPNKTSISEAIAAAGMTKGAVGLH